MPVPWGLRDVNSVCGEVLAPVRLVGLCPSLLFQDKTCFDLIFLDSFIYVVGMLVFICLAVAGAPNDPAFARGAGFVVAGGDALLPTRSDEGTSHLRLNAPLSLPTSLF